MTDTGSAAMTFAMKAAMKIARKEAEKLHEDEYRRAIGIFEAAARRGKMQEFFFDCYWKNFDCIKDRLHSDEFQLLRGSGGWHIIWQHWKDKLAPGSTPCCEAARICMIAEEALLKFQRREEHLRATVVQELLQRVERWSDADKTSFAFKWDEFGSLDYHEKEVVCKLMRGMKFQIEDRHTRAGQYDGDEYMNTEISWRHLVEEAKQLLKTQKP
jgi:hypothetical protein